MNRTQQARPAYTGHRESFHKAPPGKPGNRQSKEKARLLEGLTEEDGEQAEVDDRRRSQQPKALRNTAAKPFKKPPRKTFGGFSETFAPVAE